VKAALFIIAAFWLALGLWLTLDALKDVLGRVRAEYGSVNWPLLAFALVLTVLWSPARFFYALARGGR
jgi:hypothetical protein